MIRKDPPMDQTGGLKDEEKEESMHQLALHLQQLLGVQADLPQGLNLDNYLPVSLLLQRNLCRLPVRWRNPYIRCLKQEPINTTGTPFGEFLTRGRNVSSSMGLRLTGNLLLMYTPRGGSSLSPSSRLWNDITISIWIEFWYVAMMTIFTNLKKAISKGYASKTLKICCYSWRIVIQKRVEDLQLGVESYQKRLNPTKPDTDDIMFSTIKVVSRHQNTQQYGALLPIELTNDEIRNTKAYKEYYACATGEAAPKPKASARRKRSGSDTSITPPTAIITPTTTVAVAPRLTATAKGKQPAKAKIPTDPSKLGGFSIDEGTGSKPGVSDVPSDDSEEEISWNSSDDEDVDAQDKNRDDDEGDKKEESDDGKEDDDDDKDVAADLLEMELKKILIEKMEGNKSIQRLDEQRNLYKALVDAYETNKTIFDSYGDTAILKRRHEDGDDQKDPSLDQTGGLRDEEKTSASESAFAEETMQTTSQIEEPLHSVFETGAEDQPIVQSSQHPEWFSQPKKPPTSDRDRNKTLPAAQGSTQLWISDLAKQADSRSSFNELLDTLLDFSNFIMNRLGVDTLTPELLA
uniref:Retrovirus-related Pol polyprotein from transposon TNT 1-94 n=1 Tax=Tanacetum cinerariifolium TaxID=118510 RepID=A0A6L2JBV4_TANCI|nr:hypothetical protein [Tanacetum cinerariifolium]